MRGIKSHLAFSDILLDTDMYNEGNQIIVGKGIEDIQSSWIVIFEHNIITFSAHECKSDTLWECWFFLG